MKIKNSSRILAIILAMMMIVPMISIPTFAEIPLYRQDFETGSLTDLIESKNPSVSIKDLGDGQHGKVFYFDMNKGPTDDGNLYLIKDKNSGRHKVTEYTTNEDGTINGKVTVALSGAEPVELMFENAVVETQKLTQNDQGGLANAVQLYTIKLVEDGIDEETWEVKYREEKDQPWNNFVGAIVKCKTANAIQGGGNIATHSYLKNEAVVGTGSTVTYSMDYNVNHDWNITSELHTMRGSFRLVRFDRDGNNLIVKPHGNLVTTDGTEIRIATDSWFTLTIVADYATATIKVYVNGVYAFAAQDQANLAKIQAKVVDGKVNIDANTLQLIQVNRTAGDTDVKKETRFYDGDLMIDNVAIYDGEVLPAVGTTPTYMFSSNFNGEQLAYGFGTGTESISFTEDSNAMKIDLDTYDEETGLDTNNVKAIDKNLTLSDLPAFAPAEGNSTYFFEADYYIPEGAEFAIQGQFARGTANGSTTTLKWIALYKIEATGSAVKFIPFGASPKPEIEEHYNDLPMGEWFTLTHKVDLITGEVRHYVNGVLYSSWHLFQKGTYLENVNIKSGNNGWIIAKPVKLNSSRSTKSTTPGLEEYWSGHEGNYPNGYSGFVMVDNLKVYTDETLLHEKTERVEADKTFWTEDYSNKLVNDHAWNLSGSAPITATYTTDINNDMAVRFNMAPTADELKSVQVLDDFIAGPAGRAYWMTDITDDPTFDPADSMEVNASKLKLTINTWNEPSRKFYIARNGNSAYVYGVDGAPVGEEVADFNTLSLIGTYPIISKDDPNAKFHLETMIGFSNSNKPFTIGQGRYEYEEGAANTYLFSASYYIPAGTRGWMESQIIQGGYHDLYRFNFTTMQLENGGNGTLLANAWNHINTVMTITDVGVYRFDIYLNGVFSHSITHEIGSAIMPGAWSVAKIMNNMSLDPALANAGVFYLDDISVQTVDAAKLQTKDVPVGVISATVDGVKVPLNGYGATKFYASEVVLGEVDLQGAFAGIITTEQKASIRIDEPTGLRFASAINETKLSELKSLGYTVSFGTLIAPKDLVKGQALVHGLMDPLVDVVNVGKYYEFDGDAATKHIVGSIVKIKEGNLDRDFTARGYIKAEKDGHAVYFYSATTYSVSVADQAKATIDAGLITEGDAGYDVVAAFAAKATA